MKFSKRDIFARQSLNINNFGKLTVLPSGYVYANVNNSPIGRINEYPIDLIYKELTKGELWLIIMSYVG